MKKALLTFALVILSVSTSFAQLSLIRTYPTLRNNYIFLGSKNMDGDGHEELVFAKPNSSNTITSMTIIDGFNGNVKWQSPDGLYFVAGYSPSITTYGSSPFCDINGDGKYEFTYYNEVGGVGNINIVGMPTLSINNSGNGVPESIELSQNYPNPFNPTTKIDFEINKRDNVTINIYNSIGQLVTKLVNEVKNSGAYTVDWDGKDLSGSVVSSGTYYYQIVIGDFTSSKKMILLK